MGVAMLQQCVSCGVQIKMYAGDEVMVCHACNNCQQWDAATSSYVVTGKMPPLPNVLARLCVGSLVNYEGEQFVVSGGVYQKYDEGYSMLWAAHSTRGIIWIEEETGGIMVFHPAKDILTDEQKKRIAVGKPILVFPNKELFTVTAILNVDSRIVTGSMPLAGLDKLFITIWMQNDVGAVFRMAVNKELTGVAFIGKTLNAESRAVFLNKTLAANTAAPLVAEYACPVCRHTIPSYTAQQHSHLSCSSCFSVLAASPRGVSVIKNRGKAFQTSATFKPGDKGIVENVHWTITAIHEKQEAGTSYYWREYTLFHPEYPIHFLSEFDGHWTFLSPVEGMPVKNNFELTYENRRYDLFLKGNAVLRTAVGELAGIPNFKNRISTQEFVSPPYLMSSEFDFSTFGWYKGRYISRQEVAAAFGKKETDMPVQHGIGSSQPAPEWLIPQKRLLASFLLPLLILTLLQFVPGHKSAVVYSSRHTLPDTLTTSLPVVTPPFTLEDGNKNLEVALNSDVTNNWAESSVVLINQSTLVEYATSVGSEFYTGFDDGGHWEEGSRTNEALLTAIPEGRYRAEITLNRGKTNETGKNIELLFTRDVPTVSNYWWTVLAIALLPALLLLRRHLFEKRRWSNSDYS
ncbi:MAG: DUF4178 domain-containing protein [Bacteroidetes bacterium]|nr:DUF4178 domain-containing protein [Bacteroidota bacterium]